MATAGLYSRLTELSTTHKQTIPLIHRLQNISSAVGQGDDARLELGAEIHIRLKDLEDQLEVLRVDVEQLEAVGNGKRDNNNNSNNNTKNEKEAERTRVIALMKKLEEDLKRF